MKKLGIIILSLLLTLGLVGCANVSKSQDSKSTNTLQSIIDRGVLRVGVKEDVPNFGLRNTDTNEIEGYEIDIVKKIAKEILGDENKYELTPVTAKTRGPLLDTGDVDMIIATFTVTEERRLTYNFSTPYFEDAVGFLVKTDSGYTTLGDMDGAVIGVAQSATSKEAISAEAETLGIAVTFQEYATYPELRVALDSGRIDSFSVDKSILMGYLDDTTTILPDSLSPQEYAVTTRLSDQEFSDHIDSLITSWVSDGSLGELTKTWGLDN